MVAWACRTDSPLWVLQRNPLIMNMCVFRVAVGCKLGISHITNPHADGESLSSAYRCVMDFCCHFLFCHADGRGLTRPARTPDPHTLDSLRTLWRAAVAVGLQVVMYGLFFGALGEFLTRCCAVALYQLWRLSIMALQCCTLLNCFCHLQPSLDGKHASKFLLNHL